jgi:seryl-tRNA synthetase
MPREPVSRTPEGVTWRSNGQAVLSGAPLRLFQQLDRLFAHWAETEGAAEYRVPTFISARDLNKLDYFRSFPHLVTFPVALDCADDNLRRFKDGEPLAHDGSVRLTSLAPVEDVLTPAACYHFYVQWADAVLTERQVLTTCATCFRREAHYKPLERQWNFSMREVVCLGTSDEVKEFLAAFQARLTAFFAAIGLPIDWCTATDPFFDTTSNPRYVMQLLAPVKTEMVFGGELAIGSVNFHHSFFGETFNITRGSEPAYSGCVAFGMERWVHAVLTHFGADEREWPDFSVWSRL